MTATETPHAPRVVRSRVEPRLVERRRSVLEARRRRRRLRIGVGLALLAVLAVAVGALWSPLADVDRIDVVGATSIEEQTVLDALGIRRGDPLVTLDLGAARAGLRELPMVAGARVTRQWPDRVRVAVAEEVPLARIVADGAEVVVSDTGRVLPAGGEGLPALEVEGAAAPAEGDEVPASVRSAMVVLDRMSSGLIDDLDLARLSRAGTLELVLGDGATVRFGPVEDVPAKLGAIGATLGQVVRECMDVLDVRDPSRPTVSRTAGCDVAAPTAVLEEPVEGTDDGAEGAASTPASTPSTAEAAQ